MRRWVAAEKRVVRAGAAREAQGLSQRHFSLMVGLGQPYVSAVESGRCNVGYENPCRIADALGVRVGELTDLG